MPSDICQEILVQYLELEGLKITRSYRVGKTESALVTFKGTQHPRNVFYRWLAIPSQPHYPRKILCRQYFLIDHKYEIRLKTNTVTRTTWNTELPLNTGADTPHQRKLHCTN